MMREAGRRSGPVAAEGTACSMTAPGRAMNGPPSRRATDGAPGRPWRDSEPVCPVRASQQRRRRCSPGLQLSRQMEPSDAKESALREAARSILPEATKDECLACDHFEPKPASLPYGYCHRVSAEIMAQRSDYCCSHFEAKAPRGQRTYAAGPKAYAEGSPH